jgi:hypothetical protein
MSMSCLYVALWLLSCLVVRVEKVRVRVWLRVRVRGFVYLICAWSDGCAGLLPWHFGENGNVRTRALED